MGRFSPLDAVLEAEVKGSYINASFGSMTIDTPTGEDKVKTPVRLTLEDACVLKIKSFFLLWFDRPGHPPWRCISKCVYRDPDRTL